MSEREIVDSTPVPAWVPRKLRVGLLVDSLVLPEWVRKVIEDIQASTVAEITLVVRREVPSPPRKPLLQRVVGNHQYILWLLYQRLDRKLFPTRPDPFAPVDTAPLLAGIPVIPVTPRLTKHCDYLSDDDLTAIRAHDLDVAVRFGFRILKGGALEIARFGVWSYHHGDNHVNRGGPPGVWEVLEGHPVTGSILQVLTEELDAGTVLYRSYSATDPRSVNRNRAKYYRKSSAFLLRKLRDLHLNGPAALTAAAGDSAVWRPYSHRLYVQPRNGEMARALTRLVGRFLGKKVRDLYSFEQWQLAYSLKKGSASPDVPEGTPHRFRALVPPRDRFWADPFPVQWNGRHFVFFEELLFSESKAHIAMAEVNAKGIVGEPVRVLERDYHLSYPFVFEWQSAHYMIPESGANRAVELYRAVSFPTLWELDRVLLSDVGAVDATLAEVGGRWWMFANIPAVPGADTYDELHLFHADTPLGPWEPHRRNPVRSDVRSARPAGRLFRWNGELYRPSQDCSVSYGYAVVINRVARLDLEEYEEVEVSRMLPQWRPDVVGTHTLNAAGGLTTIDARVRRSRWSG